MLKRVSFSLEDIEVRWEKMLLGFAHPIAVSTKFDKEPTETCFF